MTSPGITWGEIDYYFADTLLTIQVLEGEQTAFRHTTCIRRLHVMHIDDMAAIAIIQAPFYNILHTQCYAATL